MPSLAKTSTKLASVAFLALLIVAGAASPATAQTFHVIHTFTGGADGGNSLAGLTVDRAGNLYGTTVYGGQLAGVQGYGIVFKMVAKNGNWLLSPLYNFQWGQDGSRPASPPTIAPDGSLYGATQYGAGTGCYINWGCGTVYHLQPPARSCQKVLCYWTENVLYRFTGSADGGEPGSGTLTLDSAGNLYGTTLVGGHQAGGVVYEMVNSGGNWTQKVLYSFDNPANGLEPNSSVIFDGQGNLYSTSVAGGSTGHGTVFTMMPAGLSSWNYSKLYDFTTDGWAPTGGVIWGLAGNLYGATLYGGPDGSGEVYEMTPSGGSWNFQTLYQFQPPVGGDWGAYGPMAIDAQGNLYGTTLQQGVFRRGTIFKLSYSNGAWHYTSLHEFTGDSDGCSPYGGVSFDQNGNLFGTAWGCGDGGFGVVWEVTP